MNIFISHATRDKKLAGLLFDYLVDITDDEIFCTSQYRSGIKIGGNIDDTLKNAITQADIVIFIITQNFYSSAYCLNETGAVWVLDKKCIPIICGNMTHTDMKGCINSNNLSISVRIDDDIKKLINYIKKEFTIRKQKDIDSSSIEKFISAAKNIVPNVKIEHNSDNTHTLEEWILSDDIKQSDLLMLYYIKDTNSYCLYNGEYMKKDIKSWTNKKSICDDINPNYIVILNGLLAREYIYKSEVYEGEYIFHSEYKNKLLYLSNECKNILNNALNTSKKKCDELPF